MVIAKVFFNDKCFKRTALQLGDKQHLKMIKHCLYHAEKYRHLNMKESDFFAIEEVSPTLFNEHFHRVNLGYGYHYEYYA